MVVVAITCFYLSVNDQVLILIFLSLNVLIFRETLQVQRFKMVMNDVASMFRALRCPDSVFKNLLCKNEDNTIQKENTQVSSLGSSHFSQVSDHFWKHLEIWLFNSSLVPNIALHLLHSIILCASSKCNFSLSGLTYCLLQTQHVTLCCSWISLMCRLKFDPFENVRLQRTQ